MDTYPQGFPFGIMDVVELLHLHIRRRQANSVYVDCPFCNDRRGKMNVNFVKNVWRCNYCDEHGGMLALYAKVNHTTNSDAYREICDILQTDPPWGYESEKKCPSGTGVSKREPLAGGILPDTGGQVREVAQTIVPQSRRASDQQIHQTYALLFEMLTLTEKHRQHLRSPKRGLSDEQIERLGYKSTPPAFLCRSLTQKLLDKGCTVQGVPGFYQLEDGNWSVNFGKRTAGILLPARGIDGLIHGAQIYLDVPLKDKDDPPEKTGAKYIWLSSSTKNMGITSGSPIHFVGDPFARTVYVTEGLLKADIAHLLMNRSFVAIAGANNVSRLGLLFALLAQNGTELIVEAHDMDKYSNEAISKGASKIFFLAQEHGMQCSRLTWNPNYKGVDDWQLAMRRKKTQAKEIQEKEEDKASKEEELEAQKELPNQEYQMRKFRIYQLDFETEPVIPFAFKGIEALYAEGFKQPPAAKYRLVCEDSIRVLAGQEDNETLLRIDRKYRMRQDGCHGRCLAASDVVELYDEERRLYFYRDLETFVLVRFSPAFVKPMLEREEKG